MFMYMCDLYILEFKQIEDVTFKKKLFKKSFNFECRSITFDVDFYL